MKKVSVWKRFFAWCRETLDFLCNHPDHLQRLGIIGAGMSLYPMMVGLVSILVWFGINGGVAALAVIPWFGWALIGMITVFAFTIIALLGTIKGIKINTPWGANVELEMADEDNQEHQ